MFLSLNWIPTTLAICFLRPYLLLIVILNVAFCKHSLLAVQLIFFLGNLLVRVFTETASNQIHAAQIQFRTGL